MARLAQRPQACQRAIVTRRFRSSAQSIHPYEYASASGLRVVDDDSRAILLDILHGQPKARRREAKLRQEVDAAEPHEPQGRLGSDQLTIFGVPVDHMKSGDSRAIARQPIDSNVTPSRVDDLDKWRAGAEAGANDLDFAQRSGFRCAPPLEVSEHKVAGYSSQCQDADAGHCDGADRYLDGRSHVASMGRKRSLVRMVDRDAGDESNQVHRELLAETV